MSQFAHLQLTADVIARAQAGDEGAHEVIYRTYARPVYALTRRLVSRPAVAEELLQEVFVEVLRSIANYSGQGAFGAWLRSIAVNKCLMYLRTPWHRHLLWIEDHTDDDQAGSMLGEALVSMPEEPNGVDAGLERALAALPPIARSVVWLHDVEGYTHVEIARLMGRTTSFSKSQLARAHVRLRELLDSGTEDLPCTPASNSY